VTPERDSGPFVAVVTSGGLVAQEGL